MDIPAAQRAARSVPYCVASIEAEHGLPFTQQFEIDVGEQQTVDDGAVLDALGVVDAVALAQRV